MKFVPVSNASQISNSIVDVIDLFRLGNSKVNRGRYSLKLWLLLKQVDIQQNYAHGLTFDLYLITLLVTGLKNFKPNITKEGIISVKKPFLKFSKSSITSSVSLTTGW